MPDLRPRTDRLLANDRAVAAISTAVLIVVAALAPVLAGIDGMRSTGCQGACRYDLVGLGAGLIAIGPAATLAAVAVLLLVLRRRPRPIWWVGVAGLLVAFALITVGDAVIAAGVGG